MDIYESHNFLILAPDRPHVSRSDGGHLIIVPKVTVKDRTELSPSLAIELMKLTMVAGEAMATVLTRRGVEIGRINYQDNGNWTHKLHIHLYGRAVNATIQKYGTPLVFPSSAAELEKMEKLEPLSQVDAEEIRGEMFRLLSTEKYQSF